MSVFRMPAYWSPGGRNSTPRLFFSPLDMPCRAPQLEPGASNLPSPAGLGTAFPSVDDSAPALRNASLGDTRDGYPREGGVGEVRALDYSVMACRSRLAPSGCQDLKGSSCASVSSYHSTSGRT